MDSALPGVKKRKQNKNTLTAVNKSDDWSLRSVTLRYERSIVCFKNPSPCGAVFLDGSQRHNSIQKHHS